MDIEVYCDESGQEHFKARPAGEHYTLIGSLWLPAELRPGLKVAINALRRQHGVFGEAKWGRVSMYAQPFYLGLVDLFFACDLRFRVLVLRADELDLSLHEDSEELMFWKFYYFLLRGWLDDLNAYSIFTDIRTNRVHGRMKDLQRTLNYANLSSTVTVQALDSSESVLMQLTDVLTGAASYRFHGHTSSQPKLQLIQRIEQHLGHPIAPTTKAVEKFNIFRMKPGGGW
jgi:hypothetical protein